MADDEFGEYLQQRILELYGYDELTPEERGLWDAVGRVEEAFRRDEEATKARVIGNAKAISAWINENPAVLDGAVPGASTIMAEHGLRFVWEAK